jgi:hypothetical protein
MIERGLSIRLLDDGRYTCAIEGMDPVLVSRDQLEPLLGLVFGITIAEPLRKLIDEDTGQLTASPWLTAPQLGALEFLITAYRTTREEE